MRVLSRCGQVFCFLCGCLCVLLPQNAAILYLGEQLPYLGKQSSNLGSLDMGCETGGKACSRMFSKISTLIACV